MAQGIPEIEALVLITGNYYQGPEERRWRDDRERREREREREGRKKEDPRR